MWGGYLEKAKALAETIDKQVNEAVGLPNEGTSSAPPSAHPKDDNDANGNDDNDDDDDDDMMMDDGWNDDFDDDDLDDTTNAKPPLESHISRGDSEIVTLDNKSNATSTNGNDDDDDDDDEDDEDPPPKSSMLEGFDDSQQLEDAPEKVALEDAPVVSEVEQIITQGIVEQTSTNKEDEQQQQQQQQEDILDKPTSTGTLPSLMGAPSEDAMVDGGGEWDEDETEIDFDDVDMATNHEQQDDEQDQIVNDETPPPQQVPKKKDEQNEQDRFYQQEDHPVLAISETHDSSTPVEDVPEPPSPHPHVDGKEIISENEHHFFPKQPQVKEPNQQIQSSEEQEQEEPIPPSLEKPVEDIPEPASPYPHVEEPPTCLATETVESPPSHLPPTGDSTKQSSLVPEDKTPSPTEHSSVNDGDIMINNEEGQQQQYGDTGWEDDMYVDDEDPDETISSIVEEKADNKQLDTEKPVSQPPPPPKDNMESSDIPTMNNDAAHRVHRDEIVKLQEEHQRAMTMMQSQVRELQQLVSQRENQLASKAEQFTTMQNMLEVEKEELRTKVRATKEEAKKRIGKAKERVQDMEKRYAAVTNQVEEAGEQQSIIAALREEGEKLARKQSEMEKAVRSAKGETRRLSGLLEQEEEAKIKALDKITSLEEDLKRTRDDLASARKGESLSGKLESNLAAAREESELKAAMNLSLEQEVKELKAETKELKQELEEAQKEAEKEKAQASKLLKREHSELLSDLEMKLRTSEREANVREDALRHEVTELRKRWQDAVRRADALSMDVQNSTAPLMRQLESTERQNRARAANWAELETKLRSDLEEYVIQNEKIMKDRNELKVNLNRLQRSSKDTQEELEAAKATNEIQSTKIQRLEAKLLEMETEGQKMREEWVEVERLANEGVTKVRSEMTQTIVESEERYRSQISGLENELREEREKRRNFEKQMEDLAANVGVNFAPKQMNTGDTGQIKEKKLKSTQNQADILASTLGGIDTDSEDEASDDDEPTPATGGFAAMEQLTQRLKASTEELKTLRKELKESEKSRESLVAELAETRQAREKLPLFEAKVEELMGDCREKEYEIRGLQDDIVEVKRMYRSQLDVLLEEKASEQALAISGDNNASP